MAVPEILIGFSSRWEQSLGIAGVSIWPLYHWGLTSSYSGRSHAFVQTDCFLYAFIAGFLWTAIPKFTGTNAPSRAIQYFLALLLIAQLIVFELQYFAVGHLLFMLAHSVFIVVVARCFIRRQHPPPETFVFVGLGLLAGMAGAMVNAGIALGFISPVLDLLGKRLLTEGMVLLLVLGVGGFLGPRLLGFAQLPNFQNLEKLSGKVKPPRTAFRRQNIYVAAGVLLVASVIAEYGSQVPSVAWLRALVATLVILMNLRPWRTPVTRTTLAWCVWTAHWLLIASLWLVAAAQISHRFPPRDVHRRIHVVDSGGWNACRALSWRTRAGRRTAIVAPARWPGHRNHCHACARVGAPFSPDSYFGHLAWAAAFWIPGMGIWGYYLIRRIVQRSRQT